LAQRAGHLASAIEHGAGFIQIAAINERKSLFPGGGEFPPVIR
jgi:hypothetical protein